MGRIDKYFNTYTKRLSFALFFIGCYFGFCLVNNFLLGSKIYNISTLSELLTVSSDNLMYKTFLGQIILNYLDTLANIPLSLLYAFGILRAIFFIFLVIFTFSKIPEEIKCMKVFNSIGLMMVITGYVFVFGFLYLGVKSTTTDLALANVNKTGLSLMIASGVELAYLLCSLFVLLFKNIKALNN